MLGTVYVNVVIDFQDSETKKIRRIHIGACIPPGYKQHAVLQSVQPIRHTARRVRRLDIYNKYHIMLYAYVLWSGTSTIFTCPRSPITLVESHDSIRLYCSFNQLYTKMQ